MEHRRHPERKLAHLLSIPFIYWVIIPAVIWDVGIELYHQTCFPLYGLPYVSRRRHITIDRHKLRYLNWLEKLNCAYCGYVNGLLAYSTQIVADTERYWCAIKHKTDPTFIQPAHHRNFVPYGDAAALEQRFPKEP